MDRQRTATPIDILMAEAEENVLRAYNLSANYYINKPVSFDQFTQNCQNH